MNLNVSAVLSPVDLPAAELFAARLDGELLAVGECFSPVDLPGSAVIRAQSLARDLSTRVIIELLSAAWVLGATETMPASPQFCSTADARAKPAVLRRLAVREVVIDEHEMVHLGGVRVTAPLRTACDLVRSASEFDSHTQTVVLRLLAMARTSVEQCIETLESRRNLPGKRRTIERLARLAGSAVADAVDVVHGVDSPNRVEHAVEVRGIAHLEDKFAERQPV